MTQKAQEEYDLHIEHMEQFPNNPFVTEENYVVPLFYTPPFTRPELRQILNEGSLRLLYETHFLASNDPLTGMFDDLADGSDRSIREQFIEDLIGIDRTYGCEGMLPLVIPLKVMSIEHPGDIPADQEEYAYSISGPGMFLDPTKPIETYGKTSYINVLSCCHDAGSQLAWSIIGRYENLHTILRHDEDKAIRHVDTVQPEDSNYWKSVRRIAEDLKPISEKFTADWRYVYAMSALTRFVHAPHTAAAYYLLGAHRVSDTNELLLSFNRAFSEQHLRLISEIPNDHNYDEYAKMLILLRETIRYLDGQAVYDERMNTIKTWPYWSYKNLRELLDSAPFHVLLINARMGDYIYQ
jgi:hypothetical protein